MEGEHTNKNKVWQKLYNEHKMNLSEQQLNDINDIYLSTTKDNFFRLGMFRFINFSFGVVGMVLALLFGDNIRWIFFTLFIVWAVYNLIHAWNNLMDYKATKPTKYIKYVARNGME